MKRKIIFVVFCLILFMIFTALGYGDIHPAYKLRGHPWDHAISPPAQDNTTRQVQMSMVLIPFNFNATLILCINKKLSPHNDLDHSSFTIHKKKCKNSPVNILKP